jgi:hypothetical protein
MAMKKLDDPDLQLKYLRLIRKGVPRGKAAKQCDLSSTTVRNYMKDNPEFYEAVLDAEEDSFDPVEATVRSMARAGDMSAIKHYEQMKRKRDISLRNTHTVHHEHTVEISAAENARNLIHLLRQRADGVAVLEGEVIEEIEA